MEKRRTLTDTIESRFQYYRDVLNIECDIEESDKGHKGVLTRAYLNSIEAMEQYSRFSTFFKIYINKNHENTHEISYKKDLSELGDYVVFDQFKTAIGDHSAEMRINTKKPIYYVGFYSDHESVDNQYNFKLEEVSFMVGDVELWIEQNGQFQLVEKAFASFDTIDFAKFNHLVENVKVHPSYLVSPAIMVDVKNQLEMHLANLAELFNAAMDQFRQKR
jgi:hypothetical protein